jgi:16S rRNA U1498 N3-methylase RsmE
LVLGWHTNQTGEEFIAPSHEGPLTTWISPLEANGDGQVWVMIGSEGYWFEEEEQEWAVTRVSFFFLNLRFLYNFVPHF